MCKMATGTPALATGADDPALAAAADDPALAAGAEDDEDEPPGVEVKALDRRNASTTEDRFMSMQTSAKPSRILEIVGLERPETPMPTKSCHALAKPLAQVEGEERATLARNPGVILPLRPPLPTLNRLISCFAALTWRQR